MGLDDPRASLLGGNMEGVPGEWRPLPAAFLGQPSWCGAGLAAAGCPHLGPGTFPTWPGV